MKLTDQTYMRRLVVSIAQAVESPKVAGPRYWARGSNIRLASADRHSRAATAGLICRQQLIPPCCVCVCRLSWCPRACEERRFGSAAEGEVNGVTKEDSGD